MAFKTTHVFVLLHLPSNLHHFFVFGRVGFGITNFEKSDYGLSVFIFGKNSVVHR